MTARDTLVRANAAAPMPLTVRQFVLLLHLGRVGKQDYGTARKVLGFPKPALTRAADALASAGLLQRSKSPDGRVPFLSLTDAGKALAAKVRDAP